MTFFASGDSACPFDAGVDVLGVLAEDDHVELSRDVFTGLGVRL